MAFQRIHKFSGNPRTRQPDTIRLNLSASRFSFGREIRDLLGDPARVELLYDPDLHAALVRPSTDPSDPAVGDAIPDGPTRYFASRQLARLIGRDAPQGAPSIVLDARWDAEAGGLVLTPQPDPDTR